MEKKYFYFGIRTKEVVVAATGSTRNVERAIFAPRVYSSATDACAACADAMKSRLGVSFFVQGFERELNIDSTGKSHGFKA